MGNSGVALLLLLCACGGVHQRLRVELIEDEVAQVVRLPSGEVEVVPRSDLPPGVREGDLVVDDRIDYAATARAVERARKARRALTSKANR